MEPTKKKVLSLTEPYATLIKEGKRELKPEAGKPPIEENFISMPV